jgi:autotransporter-associated beta strand protein
VTILNPINLNGGARTVQVDDNGTTSLDFATLAGVISGGSGSSLIKTGGGTLFLTGNNTYSGNTFINNGVVVASSIGGGSVSSSNFGDGSGILSIGTAQTAGYLLYTGAGEVAQRTINLAGSSSGTTSGGTATIDASGSGALVLNNVVNTGTGFKTLSLRGFSNDANEIKSVLADGIGNSGSLQLS